MTRKEFLRFLFLKCFVFLFLFGLFGVRNVLAKTKKAKTKKPNNKVKKKRTRKNRRSRKSKRKFRRFKYKRGGPDLRVLTKDSAFSDVPDNGVTPVEAPFVAPTQMPE